MTVVRLSSVELSSVELSFAELSSTGLPPARMTAGQARRPPIG
jgi:hypothetical protein